MRLCLSCFHLNSGRTATGRTEFCAFCGRSFCHRICDSKKHHKSPRNAQFCVQCGSQKLTEATGYLPLGCVSTAVSLVVLIEAARLAWFLLTGPVLGLTSHFFNANKCSIVCLVDRTMPVLLLAAMGWLGLQFLPDAIGKPIGQVLSTFGKTSWKVLKTGIRLGGFLLTTFWRLLFSRNDGH